MVYSSKNGRGKHRNIGVFAFVTYKNKILLVRKSYGDFAWALPGGAVEYGEKALQALKRELKEEIGFCPLGVPKFLASFYSIEKYSLAMCYRVVLLDKEIYSFRAKPTREIREVSLFPMSHLPLRISRRTRERIRFFMKNFRKRSTKLSNFLEYR